MKLPVEFDQNEIFIIIALIILYTALILAPKRFSLSLSILVILYTVMIARLSDHLLSGPRLNFYDITDSGKYDLFDLFVYMLYGPFGYFLVYFYDKWKLQGLSIVIYVVIASVVSSVFERISVYFNVLSYLEWTVWYSFCYYLLMVPSTLLFFRFIKKNRYN